MVESCEYTTARFKFLKMSKCGAWDGVFGSCLLNIFGVIMVLRLGFIRGKLWTNQYLNVYGFVSKQKGQHWPVSACGWRKQQESNQVRDVVILIINECFFLDRICCIV
eukprot:46941_1